MRLCRAVLLFWLCLGPAGAQSPALPGPPADYVTDAAGVLSPGARQSLNLKLGRFEQDSSSQIFVYLAPSLPPGAEVQDYAHKLFQAWKIGRAKRNNGVLIAAFVKDRKSRIEVGYGLEGALPDVVASRILRNEMGPRFAAGDFDGGVGSAVDVVIAATRGEYRDGAGGPGSGAGAPGGLQPRSLTPLHWVLSGVAAAVGIGIGAALRSSGSGSSRGGDRIMGGFVGGLGHGGAVLLFFALGVVPAVVALIFTYVRLFSRFQNYGYGSGGSWSSWGSTGGGWSSGGGDGWGGGGSGFSGGGGGSSGGGGASGSW